MYFCIYRRALERLKLYCMKKSAISLEIKGGLLLIFVLLIYTKSYSQIGVKASYSRASYSNIEERLKRQFENVDKVFGNNFEFGLYYRYQIKNSGFELLPGINWKFSPKGNLGLSYQRYVLEIPMIIYPLNMEGDCGCPDFSIRNKFFEKHLFFILSPSVNYEKKTLKREDITAIFSNTYFKVGLGVGILLPFTEKISLAPDILFNWAFNDKWDKGIFNNPQLTDISTSYNDMSFDLRVNYKF